MINSFRFLRGPLTALALLVPSTAALAQAPGTPSGSTYAIPPRVQSYAASYTAITTAASLTDFLSINGSATKTIYVKRVTCSGISTADGTSTIHLIKRSTADTGGTAITPSATAGGQKVPLDSANAAATATVTAYSANPTVGTIVGIVGSRTIRTSVAATSAAGALTTWDFGDQIAQHLVLRGAAQTLSVGGLGTALVAGAVLSCEIVWLEM